VFTDHWLMMQNACGAHPRNILAKGKNFARKRKVNRNKYQKKFAILLCNDGSGETNKIYYCWKTSHKTQRILEKWLWPVCCTHVYNF